MTKEELAEFKRLLALYLDMTCAHCHSTTIEDRHILTCVGCGAVLDDVKQIVSCRDGRTEA